MTRESRCHRADGLLKVGYHSKAVAKRAAKRMQSTSFADGRALTAYHCPACDQFHIAHKRPAA